MDAFCVVYVDLPLANGCGTSLLSRANTLQGDLGASWLELK